MSYTIIVATIRQPSSSLTPTNPTISFSSTHFVSRHLYVIRRSKKTRQTVNPNRKQNWKEIKRTKYITIMTN